MSLQPHQQRVVDEKNELDTKRDKLGEFFKMTVFFELPESEKDRLRTQYSIMGIYSEILGQRISAFPVKKNECPVCKRFDD